MIFRRPNITGPFGAMDESSPLFQLLRSARFKTSDVWTLVLDLRSYAPLLLLGLPVSQMWYTLLGFLEEDIVGRFCFSKTRCEVGGTLMIYTTLIAIIFLWRLLVRLRNLGRTRSLYFTGIPALASVTSVGIIRYSRKSRSGHMVKSSAFCIGARWSFSVDGVEHTGVSPLNQLPNAAVGDELWILYDQKDPQYARPKALFDDNGNILYDDTVLWKREHDLSVGV